MPIPLHGEITLDLETFSERNKRLGSQSGRQEQIAYVLAGLERPTGDATDEVLEGDLEALRLLLVDAVMDHDDYALRQAVDGLHRLLVIWAAARSEDTETIEARGELRGMHNLASMALERMVPLAILAEVSPDTLPHEILAYVADNPGCSNYDLALHTATGKTQISRAGRRLSDAGLVRKRRTGTRNAWQVTPRGIGALDAVNNGRPRPIRRQHSRT